MTGLTWALLGLTLGLALPAAILFFRQRSLPEARGASGSSGSSRAPAAGPDHRPVQARSLGRFRAVAIRPGLDCCQAAGELAGQRMLGRDAPLLPLALCDRGSACRCTYSHYKDRRDGEERRTIFGSFGGLGFFGSPSAPAERRQRTDRRDLRDAPPRGGSG